MMIENKKVNLLLVLEILALVVVLVFVVLTNISKTVGDTTPKDSSHSEVVGSESTEDSSSTEESTENIVENTEGRVEFSATVEAKIAAMTTEQKVAQLFVVTPEQLTGVDQVTIFGGTSQAALDAYPVAGMVYSSLNYTTDEQLQLLVGGAKEYYHEKNDVVLFALTEEAETMPSIVAFDTVNIQMVQNESVEGCIAAFKSGKDMIYKPADFKGTYEAILNAVNDGTISVDRLNNAVGRILTAKGV